MNRKYKVAVCTAAINQLSMNRMINEFSRIAAERGFELHILAPFSNMDRDTSNDRVQQEIFRLMEYEKPDAIVFFADMVKSAMVQKTILQIGKRLEVPVIGVKTSIEGIFNINYDVNDALKKILIHLIEEHSCRRINFISGIKGDMAFDHRLRAYSRTLEKYGIEVEEKRILYGGFWWGPTREALDAYFAAGLDLPEAFVCANDAMAIATCKYLLEKGYNIPEQVKVTGIGGIPESELLSPKLTTAKYDPTITGNTICDALTDILEQRIDPVGTIRIPCELDFSESCGCSSVEDSHVNETISGLFDRLEKERNFRHDINGIIVATNDNCVIDTLLNALPQYIEKAGIDAYALHLLGKYGDIVDLPAVGLDDSYPVIELGTKYDGEKRNTLCPISVEDCQNTLQRIMGEHGQVMVLPVHSEKILFGYIAIRYDYERFLPEYMYELSVVINLSVDAIAKRYRLDLANRQLNEMSEQTIQSLAELVEARSEVTGRHVKRVSEYTRILADGIGLSEEDTNMLRIASMMHDVGKLSIPPSILEKPGKLTKEEFDVIKTHVTEGEKLLIKSPGAIMEKACIIAKQHHEKWNGKGYLGMKGEEIDLSARIVALADVFDALVSKRPYKDAFSIDEAYKIIVDDRGEHFDPRIVDCFVEHLDDFARTKESYAD